MKMRVNPKIAAYEAAMFRMCKAESALMEERDREIALVDEEYSAVLEDHAQAMKEMEAIIEDFKAKWHDRLTEHDSKVDAIKAKYERLHQKTLRKVGLALADADK